jgi:hypothetical protein
VIGFGSPQARTWPRDRGGAAKTLEMKALAGQTILSDKLQSVLLPSSALALPDA